MSESNGLIDYSRLVREIDYASAFEGTRFEQYTGDTEGGLGSVLGGWLGALVGRFVGMALGEVAQELLVDELFGSKDDADEATESDADEASANGGEQAADEASTDETAEADAE